MASYTFTAILIIVACCCLARAIKPNPQHIPGIDGGRSYYLLYHHEFVATYEESLQRCESMVGGSLAVVNSERELAYLSGKLIRPAYIGTWNNTSNDDVCAAVYPGEVLAVPKKGCASRIDSICQIKVDLPSDD